ncbi:MAG: hypothetical protein JEZ02_09350 [Desulfatibacillum sp.]|nr:hypothetical protein [Desulfatibacillum sp.]
MDDWEKNIPKAFCLGNFWCLALALAHGATLAYAKVGVVTSQKSILTLMLFFVLCSWLARTFYRKLQALNKEQKNWVLVLTSVFPAGALSSVFTHSSGVSAFFLLPFILYAVFLWTPQLPGRTAPDLERLITLFCQVIALSLLVRTGPYYAFSFILSTGLVLAYHGIRSKKMSEGYTLEKLALPSPVMTLWFFVSLSNQISNLFPRWSLALFWAGLAVSLILAGILAKHPFGKTPWINRLCMVLFAASLVFDLNVSTALATPLEAWDFHWWVHVAPGLDAMGSVMRPFVDYAPIEGVGWAAWLPRAWFVMLDGSVAGYEVLFALLSLLAQSLYAAMLGYVLWKIAGMQPFGAALAAVLIAVANLALLQTCYPFPEGWSIAERTPGLFFSVFPFLFLLNITGQDKKSGLTWIAFGVGALHMLSFFLETLLGLGAIVSLLGVMALVPTRIPHKKYILLGGFSALFLSLLIIRPPLFDFFLVQPMTLIQSGLEHMDLSGRVNIFAIFYRKMALSTFHYSFPLAVMTAFLTLLPFTPWRRSKAFVPALYFFLITFFMFISGGQRYLEDPEGACGAVYFAGLSTILTIPLLVCVLKIARDLRSPSPLPSWLSKTLACVLIVAVCSTGLFYGKSPGPMKIQLAGRVFHATAWEDQEHFLSPHNYGLPDVLGYYYTYKNRKAVQSGPAPLEVHLQPYSAWKDNPKVLVPIHRTMGFFQQQRYRR